MPSKNVTASLVLATQCLCINKEKLTVGQILKHRDVFMVVVIVVPVGAEVSHLPSLKEPLENKFSRGSNSHRLLVTITPTIESPCFFICPRSFVLLCETVLKKGNVICEYILV